MCEGELLHDNDLHSGARDCFINISQRLIKENVKGYDCVK